MSDPSDKGSESPTGLISSDDNREAEIKKTCADCGTSKTPLWRGGPAGPKSLCNACGIKSRKKRRVIAGINKGSGGSDEMKKQKKKKKKKNGCGGLKLNPHRSRTNSRSKQLVDPWKRKLLMGLGRQVSMQRRIKLGEVEEAAVLLMALSYGSVYA